MDAAYIQVQTTLSSREEALQVARGAVERRLAGCVQIQPCTSLYRWQGAIEQDDEYLCTMKSREDLFEALKQCILDIHPYDEPEIIALPIVTGSPSYLQWLDQELLPENSTL